MSYDARWGLGSGSCANMLLKIGINLIAFPTLTFLVDSFDTAYMEGKQQLLTALHQIIADLETVGGDTIPDMGLVGLKLETLGDAALLNGDISLLEIDLINQARQLFISSGANSSYRFYEAPVLRLESRRGRPKFDITEEQLLFFRGMLICNSSQCIYPHLVK